jgi:activating signal cointegrator complex subunit 3
MVFVHSRKQTAGVGDFLVDRARKRGELGLLANDALKPSAPLYGSMLKGCKNQQLKQLAPNGIGIHHAGMLRFLLLLLLLLLLLFVRLLTRMVNRPDRRAAERLFEQGELKVLVSTATLAWGVNLPAHTVVICGTGSCLVSIIVVVFVATQFRLLFVELYNAQLGKFVEIGMLDVQQIFGRAGRPQFDTSGEVNIPSCCRCC